MVTNKRPTIDVQAGLKAFEEDLPRVLACLNVSSIEELGWGMPKPLTLLVPMSGKIGEKNDEYLLRLGFHAYRAWPPSAQFINPATNDYVYPQDQHFVPRLESNECRTHIAYDHTAEGKKIQLVCCSATFEFYDVLHSVDAAYIWSETDTFLKTINAIRRAFSESYKGRFEAHGK